MYIRPILFFIFLYFFSRNISYIPRGSDSRVNVATPASRMPRNSLNILSTNFGSGFLASKSFIHCACESATVLIFLIFGYERRNVTGPSRLSSLYILPATYCPSANVQFHAEGERSQNTSQAHSLEVHRLQCSPWERDRLE
jgi:hypothetical protein